MKTIKNLIMEAIKETKEEQKMMQKSAAIFEEMKQEEIKEMNSTFEKLGFDPFEDNNWEGMVLFMEHLQEEGMVIINPDSNPQFQIVEK